MSVTANIFGYVNDEERGVYEPAPELMTYQEIVAAATSEGYPWTDLISDLNENAEDYYTLLSNGNNLNTDYSEDGFYYINNIEHDTPSAYYRIIYKDSNDTRYCQDIDNIPF